MGRRNWLVVCVIALFIIGGCKSIFHRDIKEGIIEFDITYPGNETGELLAAFLPDEMVLKFKNGKTAGTFSAGMGVFKATMISDPESKTVCQLFKVLKNKYSHEFDSTQIKSLFSELTEPKIKFVDETKEIAGYTCKKAIVTFKDNIKEEFSVYYTNDINIKNSNWFTPFHKIDGGLLEYQVRKYNYEMRLVARDVKREDIGDNEFEVPDGYINVGAAEMDEILEQYKNI